MTPLSKAPRCLICPSEPVWSPDQCPSPTGLVQLDCKANILLENVFGRDKVGNRFKVGVDGTRSNNGVAVVRPGASD